MSIKLEKVEYADWHSAYRAWITGLDTEPPLEGAFFAGWLLREAEIERLQRDLRVTLDLLSQARDELRTTQEVLTACLESA